MTMQPDNNTPETPRNAEPQGWEANPVIKEIAGSKPEDAENARILAAPLSVMDTMFSVNVFSAVTGTVGAAFDTLSHFFSGGTSFSQMTTNTNFLPGVMQAMGTTFDSSVGTVTNGLTGTAPAMAAGPTATPLPTAPTNTLNTLNGPNMPGM